jgi:uncharacterized cupin superfamily protein
VATAHWDEVEPRRRELGPMRFTATDLGSAAGSVAVGLRRYRLEPGDRPTPPHVHGAEEEIFFVLAGSGLSWQDAAVYEIRAGDCIVHRAAEEAHTVIAGSDGLDVLAFGMRVATEVGYLPRARGVWLWPAWVETPATPSWEYDRSLGPELWHRELEAGELELPPATGRPDTIVNVEDVAGGPFGRPDGETFALWRDLGVAAGSEQTGLKQVRVPPGKLGVPPHCHSAEEELFVVLDGDGWLELTPAPAQSPAPARRRGGEPLATTREAVRTGSVIARPAGTRVAHTLRAGDDGLTYLAYGDARPGRHRLLPALAQDLLAGPRRHRSGRARRLLGRRGLSEAAPPRRGLH